MSSKILITDKEKGTYFPRGIFIALILLLLVLFCVQMAKAQPPVHLHNRSILGMDRQEACWQSSDLALTEAQTKTLEGLQCAYMAEAMPLRKELMSIRFEFRHLIRDPNVQSKILFDRQKQISELQVTLDNLWLSYQIKARSVLTKAQLEQLPKDCSLGINPEYEMRIDIGRGPRKGLR